MGAVRLAAPHTAAGRLGFCPKGAAACRGESGLPRSPPSNLPLKYSQLSGAPAAAGRAQRGMSSYAVDTEQLRRAAESFGAGEAVLRRSHGGQHGGGGGAAAEATTTHLADLVASPPCPLGNSTEVMAENRAREARAAERGLQTFTIICRCTPDGAVSIPLAHGSFRAGEVTVVEGENQVVDFDADP
eukprot:COSAG05_NODE_3328_length_2146_cov_53.993649_2_plen_187_part_00